MSLEVRCYDSHGCYVPYVSALPCLDRPKVKRAQGVSGTHRSALAVFAWRVHGSPIGQPCGSWYKVSHDC